MHTLLQYSSNVLGSNSDILQGVGVFRDGLNGRELLVGLDVVVGLIG